MFPDAIRLNRSQAAGWNRLGTVRTSRGIACLTNEPARPAEPVRTEQAARSMPLVFAHLRVRHIHPVRPVSRVRHHRTVRTTVTFVPSRDHPGPYNSCGRNDRSFEIRIGRIAAPAVMGPTRSQCTVLSMGPFVRMF